MNIGDKVRLLHGTEEGVVTRLLDNKLVEVEIEDGFSIPVLQSELVIIDANESEAFSSAPKKEVKASQSSKPTNIKQIINKEPSGYWLAVVPLNDKLHSIHFVNNSSEDILLLVNEKNNKQEERSIISSKIFVHQAVKINEYNLEHLSTWPDFSFKILAENATWSLPNRIQNIAFTIKAKHFKKDPEFAAILNKKAYQIALNSAKEEKEAFQEIDANALKESFYKNRPAETSKEESVRSTKPFAIEVDLHIEELVSEEDKIPEKEALDYQLKHFEKKLDEALMAGIDEITFIHGVGNGVLRNAIHKYLSQSDSIAYFQDAQKEKFGYGATLVKLK